MLAQAGLAPGDVLLAVNGQPLNLARLPRLASELEGRREVEIRYRRDGQLHTTLLKAPR
ncbi:MAG: PDZ domain-containing protein [Lysobacter sp.]|nr:PDZ domain-containing protein [Lysobacter sp.]